MRIGPSRARVGPCTWAVSSSGGATAESEKGDRSRQSPGKEHNHKQETSPPTLHALPQDLLRGETFRKPRHRPRSDRPSRRDDRECGGPGERRVARWASRRVPHAAMLTGMTVPPGRPGDDKASERRLRRVVETGQRSGEAGNSVGDATEQVQEAETRSREVHENGDAAGGGTDTAHAPTPEHLRRAAQLEERSYRHVHRESRRQSRHATGRSRHTTGRLGCMIDRPTSAGATSRSTGSRPTSTARSRG